MSEVPNIIPADITPYHTDKAGQNPI